MRSWRILLACLLVLAPSGQAANPDIEKRIDALLARMTLEEKLGQMSQSTAMQTPLSNELKELLGRTALTTEAGPAIDNLRAAFLSRLALPL